jgi:drug/metabolite transporter (DMT)-like permease
MDYGLRTMDYELKTMRKGIFMLLGAEFCFAAATVFAKFANNISDIPAVEITFFRFFIGVFVAGFFLKQLGNSFIPVKKTFVIWRSILNLIAVILFFTSVKYTTITNANMLNMTYPIFIFLFAPIFGTDKISPVQVLYLAVSTFGIYLVIQPNFSHLLIGDLIGLLSGIVGAASMLSLRRARETDSTFLILFYLMGIGTVLNGLMLIPVFITPTWQQFGFIIVSAILGVAGQAFVTYGYKYIESAKGGIISSSRILFAMLMGIMIFDEMFNLKLIIGAGLILWAILSLTWREYKVSR